ncbi:MAG: HEPN domain-containing protein [Planctomycetes bacterium]|jgi:uncharacterized protein (UPF0332 family)|nr:HEPN domain-containing protein [Planctomycetota bacterium]
MSEERLRELITLRMQQAAETLREARILCAGQAGRGAVSRAYYAMFYAVLALLATKELGTSRHSGTISLFDREFVKPGDLPKELSRALHLAFERRQQADYGELIQLDEQAVTRAIEEAEVFIREVQAYLRARDLLSSNG